MPRRVLIIGAGIAGLSAASYLQRNGFETEVFEMHTQPGGLCTAWKRGGFTFDGCIHWLMGSGPSSNLHWIWKELGAGDLNYIEWDVYMVVRLSDGDTFTVYTNPDKLEAEMLRLGPDDRKTVDFLIRGIKKISRLDLPAALDRMTITEKLRLLPRFLLALATVFKKWIRTPVSETVAGIHGEKLREALTVLVGEKNMVDFPVGGLLMMLGFMAKRSNGYPLGGSAAFARAIENKYLKLGGKIHYGFKVDEIAVEKDKAVGLKGHGQEVRGDIVISAADAHDTVTKMLGGRYVNPDLAKAFESYERFPSMILVSLGLGKDYSAIPPCQIFALKEPLILENGALRRDRLAVRFFTFDPSSAPSGKTAAVVMIETPNDDYWTGLRADHPEAYAAEKTSTAEKVIAALNRVFPGLKDDVEVVDVATLHTVIRYTNNWHGSFEGWRASTGTFGKKMAKTFPGLSGLYMVGQWVNPGGGLPPCSIDGRNLAKKLCKLEGRKFRPD
ncbi:MAG: NAD(P)/FAD-dependent oxidoreductase [Candidatus Aminicenantales bacterium]